MESLFEARKKLGTESPTAGGMRERVSESADDGWHAQRRAGVRAGAVVMDIV